MRHDDFLVVEDDRPILPWRLVAGAFLHFVVPFYLIALLLDLVLGAPPRDWATMVHHALLVSPPLLGGYAGLAVLATLLAALVDPLLHVRRARRRAADPRYAAAKSAQRVRDAASRGRTLFGPSADAVLARLATARWDHADPRQQALSRDLLDAATASAAAFATASPERRAAIADMVAGTFAHIADAQSEYAAAGASEDERKARIIAGYVETRYGSSDFSGEAP